MDALEIGYRIRRAGKTHRELAEELGVAVGVISNVIHNRVTAYGVAAHIAGLLGHEVEELWPDRYRFKPRRPRRESHLVLKDAGAALMIEEDSP